MKDKKEDFVFYCLDNPRISRVLVLIDLAENGLTQACLFSLLGCPKDKGVRKALTELEKAGLVKRVKKKGRPVRVSDDFQIQFGLEGIGKRYVVVANPIEALFTCLEKKDKRGKINRDAFKKIKAIMLQRYAEFKQAYSLDKDYLHLPHEGFLKELERKLPNSAKARADFQNLLASATMADQKMKELKASYKKEILISLRRKSFSYTWWVSNQLLRILLEQTLLLYRRNRLNYRPAELIEFGKVLYALLNYNSEKPFLDSSSDVYLSPQDPKALIAPFAFELIGRIKSFPNILELEANISKINKEIKKLNHQPQTPNQ